MSSKRKIRRSLERWHRYYRRYPEQYCGPGILVAYNRLAHAQYAQIRREHAATGAQ